LKSLDSARDFGSGLPLASCGVSLRPLSASSSSPVPGTNPYARCFALFAALRCAFSIFLFAFFGFLAALFWSFLAAFCACFALSGPR